MDQSETQSEIFSTSIVGQRIAYFTFRQPPKTDEDWAAYETAFRWFYDNMDKFVLCFDMRDLEGISEYFIEKKAQLLEEMKPRTREQVIGTAVIMNSPVLVALLNMLLVRYNNTRPVGIFNEDNEATDWLIKQMVGCFGKEQTMSFFAAQ